MKKFTLVIICLLMVVSCCMAGCSTFTIDYVKFYNETVAKVDNKEFTRFDLINSYNNYGYNYYVTQQNKSEKEALNETLNLMIDRELLSNYAKDTAEFALSDYDINSIYQEVLDYMDETFDSYCVSAREMLNFDEIEDATEDEEDSTTAYKQEDYKYTKRARLGTGNIIEYIDDEEEIIDTWALDSDFVMNYSSKTKNDIVTKIYAKFIANASYNKHNEENYDLVYNKAMSLFAKYLISYQYYLRTEDGKSYSTDTVDMVKRLIERVYDNEVNNKYIANLENNFLKTAPLSINKLITRYTTLVETDYAKYETSTADYYEYLKTIGSDAEMVYYTPSTASAKFGYFLHTLLPLDKTITTAITDAKSAGIYDETAITNRIAELIANETHQERDADTGLLKDGDIRIPTILTEYTNSVTNVDQFMDFMFKYTSDTATLTADMPYVIGYDESNTYSSMVTEFTDEAIRLMKNDLAMTAGNEFIVTEYGIHLLYYVGPVNAKFAYTDRNSMNISLDDTLNNNLYYEYTNEFTEKTYFDLLFDLVYPASDGSVYTSENGYSDYEKNIVNTLKKDNVIIYSTKLKSTIKGI